MRKSHPLILAIVAITSIWWSGKLLGASPEELEVGEIKKAGGHIAFMGGADASGKRWVEVYLDCHSQVTDAALEHLNEVKNLRYLVLSGSSVTDAELEHLKGLNNLASLELRRTMVTGAGLDRLAGL